VNRNVALLLQQSDVMSLAYDEELVLTVISIFTASIIMLWISVFVSLN